MTIAFVLALFFQVMDEHNIVRKEHGLEFFDIDFKLQDAPDGWLVMKV
jgi:hypothetical protein